MTDVEERISASARWFREVVWGEISHWFGDDVKLHTTEMQDSPVAEDFDTLAGVDYWITVADAGMVSLASRVQYVDYTTFTIRYERPTGAETEYQKRRRQYRNNDYELPTWTVQAYVDTTLGVIRNVAAVRTQELYSLVLSREVGDDWPIIPVTDDRGSPDGKMIAVDWQTVDDECEMLVKKRARAGLYPAAPDDAGDITAWG